MANPAFAFLTTTRFDIGPPANPQQITVSYQGIVGDGTQQLDFASTFIYDNTLSQTMNLNAAKDQLIALVATQFPGLTRTNIKFNLQFN